MEVKQPQPVDNTPFGTDLGPWESLLFQNPNPAPTNPEPAPTADSQASAFTLNPK